MQYLHLLPRSSQIENTLTCSVHSRRGGFTTVTERNFCVGLFYNIVTGGCSWKSSLEGGGIRRRLFINKRVLPPPPPLRGARMLVDSERLQARMQIRKNGREDLFVCALRRKREYARRGEGGWGGGYRSRLRCKHPPGRRLSQGPGGYRRKRKTTTPSHCPMTEPLLRANNAHTSKPLEARTRGHQRDLR